MTYLSFFFDGGDDHIWVLWSLVASSPAYLLLWLISFSVIGLVCFVPCDRFRLYPGKDVRSEVYRITIAYELLVTTCVSWYQRVHIGYGLQWVMIRHSSLTIAGGYLYWFDANDIKSNRREGDNTWTKNGARNKNQICAELGFAALRNMKVSTSKTIKILPGVKG